MSDYTDEARLRDVLDPLLIHHTGIIAPDVDPIVDEFVAAVQQVWSAELSLLREQNEQLRSDMKEHQSAWDALADAYVELRNVMDEMAGHVYAAAAHTLPADHFEACDG